MKKRKMVFVFLLMVVVSVLISSCNRVTLKVFLPTEYISLDLVKSFEKEYGVKVNVITFESNELAIPMIENGSYDVVIPSDYAIEELASKNLFDEIDWSLIDTKKSELSTNLLTAVNKLNEGDNGFDLLKYSVPYFFGNIGILYDTTKTISYSSNSKTAKEVLELEGWNALSYSSPSSKVSIYDSTRDMYMIALKKLYADNPQNLSVNNPTVEDINNATTWLKGLSNNPNVNIITDEILDDMAVSNKTKYAYSIAYSGDAIYLMDGNENLDYYVPESGTNVFIDAMCVPKNAANKDLAYKFINFFLDKDNQYSNSSECGYTSVVQSVIEDIIKDEVYKESSYNIIVKNNDEVYRYNEELKNIMDNEWIKIKG
ncbi:MAG: extracellular solute-binding protein [Acholeplasmatales bacterium]|jgi:spermidine/putrescine-binding protein|nr:extracellular solute-binding protein [Acholeplasmatales bacterium]